jgi:hypothetical protein
MTMFRRLSLGVAAIALFSLFAWAGKTFVMPTAKPAASYPAHDTHTNEQVTVGLDPYDTQGKANIFSVKYNEVGYLPMLVVVTNDGDEPVSLQGMRAELITSDRTKISPADEDDLYRRLAHPTKSTSTIPIPFPRTKIKGGMSSKALNEIQNSRFAARAVEPHSTQSGFMFFDVSGISSPLAGTHFYLSGLHNAQGNDLMYFEIALDKYLTAPAQ